MDRESDQVSFERLAEMTGFPAEVIKRELLDGDSDDSQTVELSKLRLLMAKFLDRELLNS